MIFTIKKNMKIKIKHIVFSLATLVVAACSSHKPAISSSAPATSANVDRKSLLWEVSGKGVNTSYVYGTIHLIPKDDFLLTEATKKAFAKTQRLTLEINMQDMQNPVALMGVMSKAMMPNNKTLSDVMSAEDYKIVKARFDALGLPMMYLEHIKPMFLSMMMGTDGEKLSMGGDDKSSKITSYELEFMQMAEKDKKEMAGLETIDFQMSMFDSIPLDAQAKMLVKAAKDTNKKESNELQELVKIYLQQDIDGMSKTLQKDDGGDMAQYENMLIIDRNAKWIPLMANQMKSKPTLFAVGAGHLGGDKGVINLLQKAGYTVKPMK